MVHVTGERSNLLLHKAKLTILSFPSLHAEKYSTVTVCSDKEKQKPAFISASQENKELLDPVVFLDA